MMHPGGTGIGCFSDPRPGLGTVCASLCGFLGQYADKYHHWLAQITTFPQP